MCSDDEENPAVDKKTKLCIIITDIDKGVSFCTEKKVKQKEQGKTSVKWALLFVGLGCLILSAVFALVFYQMTA